MGQLGLSSFGGGIQGPRINSYIDERVSDDASFSRLSCPWCLEPRDGFERNIEGQLGCNNCEAIIPEDSEWYQNGEKIVI